MACFVDFTCVKPVSITLSFWQIEASKSFQVNRNFECQANLLHQVIQKWTAKGINKSPLIEILVWPEILTTLIFLLVAVTNSFNFAKKKKQSSGALGLKQFPFNLPMSFLTWLGSNKKLTLDASKNTCNSLVIKTISVIKKEWLPSEAWQSHYKCLSELVHFFFCKNFIEGTNNWTKTVKHTFCILAMGQPPCNCCLD